EASEYLGRLQVLAVREDVPAEPAAARGRAEHQLGRDQGAPGEGPADLEAGQDRSEGGGYDDLDDVGNSLQAVIAPDHPQCRAHRQKPDMRAQGHRPEDGMDDDEDEAGHAE